LNSPVASVPASRLLAAATAILIVTATSVADESPRGALERADHLVLAVPDLEAGIDWVESLTGVRAVIGGRHPGMGTWNALIALGPTTYLEIIAPDPTQATYRSPRVFRVDEVDAPRLMTWAANASDVAALSSIELPGGQAVGDAHDGSRDRPDGVMLRWTLSDPYVEIAEGVVPFFIDWGDTPHPAGASPRGAVLTGLRAEHPQPDEVRQALEQLGIDLPVTAGPAPALIATLDTPNGTVELR
jgi:hypothetical protein